MLACTRTAISALAWPVSATCPPIPAVLRPALRCVTCRTLTSVLLQLRSASFCRFLASGQSPACTALKIRPRSRRTCSSWRRQSTRSQASPSNEGRPSGPFTEVPNVPVSSGIYARFASKAHLPTSAPLRARASRSLSGQLYEHRPGGDPLPFGRRHSLPGHPVPPAGFRPSYDRPTGRPAPTRACRTDPGEVSTFRTHETRTGPDALYTPGTVVFAGRRPIRGRRLPPLSGRSLAPRYNDPARDVSVTRHQQGFPDSRPVPVLPLTCEPPWLERRPSGFPVSSAPSRSGTGHARHGGDRSNTDP